MKEVYTTGQVAGICNVTIRTVIKWFESGRLKGYKIPGSKDRRIPHESLVEFMQQNGLPLKGLEGPGRRRILIADDFKVLRDVIRLYPERAGVRRDSGIETHAKLEGHS